MTPQLNMTLRTGEAARVLFFAGTSVWAHSFDGSVCQRRSWEAHPTREAAFKAKFSPTKLLRLCPASQANGYQLR